MALIKSPTKIYWTDVDSGEVVTVIFDAVTVLTPDDVVDVTEHPVEEGIDTSDNARSAPGTLAIEATVSMAPNPALDTDVAIAPVDLRVANRAARQPKTISLDIPTPPVQFSESGLLNAGIGALSSAIFGAPKATVLDTPGYSTDKATASAYQQSSPRNRIRDVYDTLLKLKDDHTLVTILTAHRDHFDMMLTHLGESRTTADGTSARFTLEFKQLRIVSSETVSAPKPAEPRAQLPKNGGSQSGEPAANGAALESALSQGAGAIAGFAKSLFGGG